MNTVLDDNKKLCLNSGQIIQLTPRMTMMFEVEDLAVASPATVSRCGMVYMEPQSLTLQPLIDSWMNTMPEKVKANKYIFNTLMELWNDMMADGCYFLRRNLHEIVRTVDNNITQSCMRLMDCYLAKYHETEIKKINAEQIENLAAIIKPIFMFCFMWSVGGTTDLNGRKRFDAWIKERMAKHNVTFPEEKQCYDWHFNLEKAEWVSWFDTIPVFDVDIRMSYSEIVVPTDDSIRMKYLMRTLMSNDKHVLMPGPTGTGKSVYVQ
jgi:dynein heavy chain